MVHKVTFTKTADKAFYEIALFLEENASRSVAVKFANRVDFTIEKLITSFKQSEDSKEN
jgi:hypothetical protein